ncbi:hypothetical protein [Flavobacterium sp.]|uniref:hypothetical protein n=1 Tax=Flavobacterium sp. TaxID=239 RepID=UPI002FD96560
MKAKITFFSIALLIAFLLLGCSNDDANSNSNLASLTPKAPSGDRMQVLPLGSTVSDLHVYGENIKWYRFDYSLSETPEIDNGVLFSPDITDSRILLSPQTYLQDRKIYFATQTINNIESNMYLPVTVKLMKIVR